MARIRLALAFLRALISRPTAWIDTRTGRLIPMIAGAEEPEPDPKPDPPAADDPPPDPDDGKGPIDMSDVDEVKRAARKHEREAKAERKRREELEARLAQIDDENKTEQEKAIEKAREEAASEVKKAAAEELRAERLNAAIAREAAKDFADVDDAIRLLDADDDELFDDDGKVQTDALKTALDDLLERKPHLKADAGRPGGGGADGGKGGSGSPSLEEMSTEDHLKAIQRTS